MAALWLVVIEDVEDPHELALICRQEELVLRCVDGEKNGALPKCPKCSKKTLKPNDTATAFVCPGYYEDGGFVKCSFSGTKPNSLPKRSSCAVKRACDGRGVTRSRSERCV